MKPKEIQIYLLVHLPRLVLKHFFNVKKRKERLLNVFCTIYDIMLYLSKYWTEKVYCNAYCWACQWAKQFTRRWFRLPQRSHLRTLKNFVSEKSGKLCKKSGKYWIKSGNWEILRRFIFFLYLHLLTVHLVIN